MSRRVVLFAVVVFALAGAAPATAAVYVPRGQTVDEVKVLGEDVRVDGRVRGSVVVVGGKLHVGKSGEVANVTVILGKLTTERGARVEGDVFQFGTGLPVLEGWLLVLVLALLLVLRTLLVSLIVASGALLAAKTQVLTLNETVRARPVRTLTIGALLCASLTALSILLALTVIGLVATVALLGVLVLATVTGVAMALAALDADRRARRLALVALLVPIVGDALGALATVIGLGALLRHFSGPRSAPATRPVSDR